MGYFYNKKCVNLTHFSVIKENALKIKKKKEKRKKKKEKVIRVNLTHLSFQ